MISLGCTCRYTPSITPVAHLTVDPRPPNPTTPRDSYGPVNQAIADAATRFPNLTVGDWNTYVSSRTSPSSLRSSDGLHYTSSGYIERARFTGRLASGVVALFAAHESGKVRGWYSHTTCPGVTIQLRRRHASHSKITVSTSPKDLGDAIDGEMLEFFVQSTGSHCSVTWHYLIT